MSNKRLSPSETVNCEKAARGVWLVKVPRYLSELWEKNAGSDVGRLVTGLGETGRDVVYKTTTPVASTFSSNSTSVPSTSASKVLNGTSLKNFRALGDPQPLGKPKTNTIDIPTEHQFIIRDLNSQAMAVLCEDKSGLEEEAKLRTGKLSVEGRVVKRAECQPPSSNAYMKMKIRQIEKNRQPKKEIKQIDRAVVKYKPTTAHNEHLSKVKKDSSAKYMRGDRNDVMQTIFQAFEKHQYYRLADLQRLTNQPANFVREILLDIASYSTAPPHKSMWELKPEYRNYKAEISKEFSSLSNIT